MKIEFESIEELKSWVTQNTKVDGEKRKWVLAGANEAIRQARREGAAIFNRMRQEAKSLGIPDSIIETDLAAFADDFQMTDQGEIRSLDGTHSLRTFLGKEQANRTHWKEATPAESNTTAPKNENLPLGRSFENGTSQRDSSAARPGSLAALFETS